MRPFDAVLFDLGGTLIYFDSDWAQVFKQANTALTDALQSSGLKLEHDFIEQFNTRLGQYYTERDSEFVEYTTAYVLRSLLTERGYPYLDEASLRGALRAMYAVSQSHWQAEQDAVPTLEELRSQGYRLAMISNAADDEDVQALVDKAGLRQYFEFILTSAAAGIRKPNPRLFDLALERLGTPAGRAAMVGDSLGADILGAQNAGIYSIWITRRADVAANRAHADTIQPDAVIEDLGELPVLLASLTEQ
jgi:2-haloalkanoic acid dehalogenase type II